ncbi:transmembrane GTPase Marf [Vanessa cardui]|uniref:transmembrane GTPase Marf n=1 Tax=Vanessa cardui TaxID=171605 RepID=UPI001F1290F0|nr:transmembrane GTPase Marf [Vanessa cardui]XP_046965482.1 transmembrane GTPase Marf [Vanessa cardui]XP_046965483.1 transmembrane GTPase Marf [Vanessa cardui]XP_046965484.1 transmembrane GTPase Marf [Vanessa cardui]XP_046965485.1 transmembrane GTPase Marf [Vanessa cardui]XP_046965486.1 transmembrane GTPase Marf [Vanessa cardui]
MAAYVNRTISMMAGDGPHNVAMNNGTVRVNMSNVDSPLQIFVRAKKKINDIFVEIDDYVKDAVTFMHAVSGENGIATAQDVANVEAYVSKVQAIREVLKRDHMKVAFFGRTSNGKSTVINAMLHDKILPSGIGHTTNCFLQVEGSDTDEAFMRTEGSEEKLNVQSVSQLGHALCASRLQECSLVHVHWPRELCALLRDDVVLVDSPGVDVTPNLDQWIDKHCLDADVFVLVANAESTLMVTEKNFFHKVSTKISQPNIFILNNRWDASASEPEYLDQVRSQHANRCVDFLSRELRVCTPKEAEERIFFISAKEALLTRMREREKPVSSPLLADGHQVRYFEFVDFERKFEECISQSAVRTKFAQHSRRGKNIAGDVMAALELVYNSSSEQKAAKVEKQRVLQEQLSAVEEQLTAITRQMKDKIGRMVESVEHKVSLTLSQEIRRLSALVDEYEAPFRSERGALEQYKRALHRHVEAGLGSRLKKRLSADIGHEMDEAQKEMAERMYNILPMHKRAAAASYIVPHQQPFEVLYRLNCDNLCADFQEDLTFRFSYGITALIQRFQGRNTNKIALKNPPTVTQIPPSMPPAAQESPRTAAGVGPLSAEEWSMVSKFALGALTSQGTMGGLLLSGLLLKTVGWRVVAVTGLVYGALYAYERLTWTTRAQERVFKRQYVAHAGRKLRLIVDLTSANCSHQVQQELSTMFARLCRLVDEATTEMDSELTEVKEAIKMLDGASTSAKKLRNKANYLCHELELFDDAFLKH